MTEATGSKQTETREPAEIERDIAQTRRAIDSTVEELGERLAPSQLVDDAKSYMKETAVRQVNNMWTRMSDNAVPLGLIGGGVVWMLASRRHHAAYDNDYDYGRDGRFQREDSRHGIRETASELAASGTERAREVAGRIRERGADVAGRAQDQVQRQAHLARETFDTMRDEQPLLLGIAALACGALIGGMVPTTRREDELVGELRDQVVDAATEAGREKVEQVREAAETKAREVGSRQSEGAPSSERRPDPLTGERRSGAPSGAPQHTGI
jgi:hypothetical protein